MDTAKYFIEKKVSSWLVTVVLLVGGLIAFTNLGRLEDPEFTIKQANIITMYPGATPIQVENEVTFAIEEEMQNLAYVDQVISESRAGMSYIEVHVKDFVRSEQIAQVWDEVRKKLRDRSANFPPGVGAPMVIDDFSDVYGIMLALSGEGFTYQDLETIGDELTKELVLVPGVSKARLAGEQVEQVFIEIPRGTLSSLGLPVAQVAALLNQQNAVTNAGYVDIGSEYVRIRPTGEFQSVEELKNLNVVSPINGESIKLGDIAEVRRGLRDPSNHLMGMNGKPALMLGVSFTSGVNVVEAGKTVMNRIEELKKTIPLGVNFEPIYVQSVEVEKSVNSFLLSLAQAVGIVIIVLLLFMGVKSGFIIGLILAITIFGTFIVMDYMGINLQRISLGGLIIALGMLVDNAIVITEGILIGLKKGKTKLKAAQDIVFQTRWPLLGATVIAVTAFAPIGLSPDSVGEFVGSLFYVLMISLLLSWFTAVTLTPFFCEMLFKEEIKTGGDEEQSDPYGGILFTVYKSSLKFAMRFRLLTVVALVAAFVTGLMAFANVKQAFFPPSATPMFFIELRYPEGTSINYTQEQVHKIEEFISSDPGVEFAASTVNQGFLRFILTYSSVERGSNNAQLAVRTHDREYIQELLRKVDTFIRETQPEVEFILRRMELGPSSGAPIEARFSGKDPQVLRELAEKTKEILRQQPSLTGIRDDWKQRVKVIRPIFNELKAAEIGISKTDFDRAILTHYTGDQVGVYRDETKLLPIVITVPEIERNSINQLQDVLVYSSSTGQYVSLSELVSDIETVWEDPIIHKRDRHRTLTVMATPKLDSPDNTNGIFQTIRPFVEELELPDGYFMEWGGEYENSSEAQANVYSSVPLGYMFMFIITILLFNSLKESLVVWLCVPLALIGIVSGLLMLDVAFGFMGFLGFLSLSGMVVKNGIVLIDQINVEVHSGKPVYNAVFDSAVSRVRPVLMAAVTTILGLLPLLSDPFFRDMAVVISFGLGFATVLTLIAVPVFYQLFFGIKAPKGNEYVS